MEVALVGCLYSKSLSRASTAKSKRNQATQYILHSDDLLSKKKLPVQEIVQEQNIEVQILLLLGETKKF